VHAAAFRNDVRRTTVPGGRCKFIYRRVFPKLNLGGLLLQPFVGPPADDPINRATAMPVKPADTREPLINLSLRGSQRRGNPEMPA
jgi:hypothetical protein